MTETGAIVRRVVVEGYVQGVGYREFTRRMALRLGVSGWVRNRSDGAVEALVRGPPRGSRSACRRDAQAGHAQPSSTASSVTEHDEIHELDDSDAFVIWPTA